MIEICNKNDSHKNKYIPSQFCRVIIIVTVWTQSWFEKDDMQYNADTEIMD
jgi:hypothetical protein